MKEFPKNEKHFLQTKWWAQVREAQGHKIIWSKDKLIVVKKMPKGFKDFGVMNQVDISSLDLNCLNEIALEQRLSHIHIDPINVTNKSLTKIEELSGLKVVTPVKPLILRESVLIDLEDKTEEDLLQSMKKNTRYNSKYGIKKGIKTEITNELEKIEIFLKLFFPTSKRANFFGRNPDYYRQIWEILAPQKKAWLAISYFENEPLVARFLFTTDSAIFTPYTGYSKKHSKLKPTYASFFEVLKWGVENKYKFIDLWGIKSGAQANDSEYGFSQFKLGYSDGESIKYIPSLHIVFDSWSYTTFKIASDIRSFYLQNIKKKLKL